MTDGDDQFILSPVTKFTKYFLINMALHNETPKLTVVFSGEVLERIAEMQPELRDAFSPEDVVASALQLLYETRHCTLTASNETHARTYDLWR